MKTSEQLARPEEKFHERRDYERDDEIKGDTRKKKEKTSSQHFTARFVTSNEKKDDDDLHPLLINGINSHDDGDHDVDEKRRRRRESETSFHDFSRSEMREEDQQEDQEEDTTMKILWHEHQLP